MYIAVFNVRRVTVHELANIVNISNDHVHNFFFTYENQYIHKYFHMKKLSEWWVGAKIHCIARNREKKSNKI